MTGSRLLDRLTPRPSLRLTPGQLVLRLVLLVAPTAALLLTVPAGNAPATWLVLLVVLASATWAGFPESAAGSGAFLLVLAWWGLGLRDGLHPAALGAAALLLVAHLAALLAAYGPGSMPLDGAVLRRWALRGLLVLLPAPAVYALLVAVRGRGEPPGVWLAGLAALLAALAAATVLRSRSVE